MSYLFNEEAFDEFRTKHPQLRYWQALRAFLGVDRIEVVYHDDGDITREDTFYWHDDK